MNQSLPIERAAPAYHRIAVDSVTPVIGAEISDVDLSQPVDEETAAEIRQAIRRHRVIFFRDQRLSNAALKAFARTFGPLTPAHPIAQGLASDPEIWERGVDEYRTRRTRNDTLPPGRIPPRDFKGWHIDITFVANPNAYSILYGAQIPAVGGDTLFTNLIEAYRGLSPPIQRLVDELQTVHQTRTTDFAGARRSQANGVQDERYVALHPLVRVHPETGEKLLFLNPGTVTHIAGLKEPEGRALIDLLYGEISRPEYQVRLRWRPDTLVVWDNQAVAHAGPIDYAHFDLPRVVRRVTTAGQLAEGPDGFVSQQLEGALFETLG